MVDIKVLRRSVSQREKFSYADQVHDEPKELMRLLAETFGRASPSGLDFWKNRIVLGYWTVVAPGRTLHSIS